MGILWDSSFPAFLTITLLLGGGASYMAGRAIAQTWQPLWHLLPTAAVLGFGVRFLHFALFGGTLLAPGHLLVDALIMLAFAALGYRRRRAAAMTRQYAFAYEPAGPFGWRRRPAP
jgi:hypothetical protein